MKKLLAGCLVALVLVGVAAAVAAYFAWQYIAPVVQNVRQATGGVTALGGLAEIEQGLTNTAAFDAPESGELTPAQVQRFIGVQAHVRAALGDRAEAFTTKYRELSRAAPDGTPSVPSPAQLLAGMSDLANVYLDARRAQVAAMNAAGFSRDEFSWVRQRVYQAAGLDAVRYDARDLERLIKAVASGAQVAEPAVTLPDAPARNRALVKPHVPELANWLGLAVFGL